MMDIFKEIQDGTYFKMRMAEDPCTCQNGHVIANIYTNPNYCQECGVRVKEFLQKRADEREALQQMMMKDEIKIMKKFKKDALEYCGLLDNPQADDIYQTVFDREGGDNLKMIVKSLCALSKLFV